MSICQAPLSPHPCASKRSCALRGGLCFGCVLAAVWFRLCWLMFVDVCWCLLVFVGVRGGLLSVLLLFFVVGAARGASCFVRSGLH